MLIEANLRPAAVLTKVRLGTPVQELGNIRNVLCGIGESTHDLSESVNLSGGVDDDETKYDHGYDCGYEDGYEHGYGYDDDSEQGEEGPAEESVKPTKGNELGSNRRQVERAQGAIRRKVGEADGRRSRDHLSMSA